MKLLILLIISAPILYTLTEFGINWTKHLINLFSLLTNQTANDLTLLRVLSKVKLLLMRSLDDLHQRTDLFMASSDPIEETLHAFQYLEGMTTKLLDFNNRIEKYNNQSGVIHGSNLLSSEIFNEIVSGKTVLVLNSILSVKLRNTYKMYENSFG